MTLGGPITTLNSYPGATVSALVMDPQNYQHIFVLDTSGKVWGSFNEGSTWTNLTANLPTVSNVGPDSAIRTIQIFSPSPSPLNTVLLAGGVGGVWQMRRPGAVGTSWTTLASGLPHALIYDLRYNYTDNVLSAGTLGRGVWSLSNFFRGGGGTGVTSTSVSGATADRTYPSLGVVDQPVARPVNPPAPRRGSGPPSCPLLAVAPSRPTAGPRPGPRR